MSLAVLLKLAKELIRITAKHFIFLLSNRSAGNRSCKLGKLLRGLRRRDWRMTLPLFKAEQHRLGEMNTLMSLSDLEDSLGETLKAIRHYDDARILCSLIHQTKNAKWLAKRISELKNSEGA